MTQLCERPAHVDPARVVDYDMYNPPMVDQGFHQAVKRLQPADGADVVWTPRNGGHWIAVRGGAIQRVLSDYEYFSNQIGMVPKEQGLANRFLPSQLDPPAYTGYRSIVVRAISPRRVASITDDIRDLAVALIEKVRANGRCDFVKDFAEQLPIQIFLKICDLPLSDAAQLKLMTDRMLKPDPAQTHDEMAASRAGVTSWFRRYLAPVIASRRGGKADDVLTTYANARVDGRLLAEDEIISMATVLLFAGLDTVVNFLCFTFHFLATHNDHRQALEKEPSGIAQATEELLRRFGIVTLARVVAHDVELDGAELRAGDMIIIPTFLHGLDDRITADPMTVDFDRPRIEYSVFGQGAHRCIGLVLAKTEIRITLEEWLSRVPGLRLAPNAEAAIRYGGGLVGSMTTLPLEWDF